MTGDGQRFISLGRYLGKWPDRRAEAEHGRAIQVGFEVVPIPRIELYELWQAAREGVQRDDVGMRIDKLIVVVRERRVSDPSQSSPPLKFARAATLGDQELEELAGWLVERGLLAAVPDGEEALGQFLTEVRLFAGTDAAEDQSPDIQGNLRLANGRQLDPALFTLWAWCSVHDSLDLTHRLTYDGQDSAHTLAAAARVCAESGGFLDRVAGGTDRSSGSGLASLVGVPSGIPSRQIDESRWLGLRARRTAGRTFALGQLVGRSPEVDHGGNRLVRLGKGIAEIDDAAYWSWSRAFGRAGNLGRVPVGDFPHEATSVAGGPEAAVWLIDQPLLFGIGGTDDDLVRQASQVRLAPRNWSRDSTHEPPRPTTGGSLGLGFELAVFGHLEQNLWATVQAVAAQRSAEGRADDEGGSEPLEILRAFLLSPESAIKYAGYLDLA